MGTPSEKKNIYIVDDHSVVRDGLSQIINYEKDLQVCGTSGNVNTAINEINTLMPDLVIVDLSLKESSGIELTHAIKSRFNIAVLILSMYDEKIFAERAIRAGARGYIMKTESTERIIYAIREILSGNIFLDHDLKERLLNKFLSETKQELMTPLDPLTNREIEVFQMIGKGMSSKHIAHTLSLSIKTIETYKERIKDKLGLKDSEELNQYAVQWDKIKEPF